MPVAGQDWSDNGDASQSTLEKKQAMAPTSMPTMNSQHSHCQLPVPKHPLLQLVLFVCK